MKGVTKLNNAGENFQCTVTWQSFVQAKWTTVFNRLYTPRKVWFRTLPEVLTLWVFWFYLFLYSTNIPSKYRKETMSGNSKK